MVQAGQRAAAEECRLIRENTPRTWEFFQLHLRRYILYKFLLTETEGATDALRTLARQSVAKAMGLSRELAFLQDTSAGCSNASSVDTKLALLLMAIQRDFQVQLPLPEAVRAETVEELAEIALKDKCTATNPRAVSKKQMVSLMKRIYNGR